MTHSYWAFFRPAIPFFPPMAYRGHWCSYLWAPVSLLFSFGLSPAHLLSLDFPGPISLFLSLGLTGLPLTPYFLCLHCFGPAAAHSHFSIPHTAHGCHFSLFGPSRPICFLKTHLFILWACDPLFLPLGLNGFALCLPFL